jgi:hypothetical protein
MTDAERAAFRSAIAALVAFRSTFGCELRADSVAEMYVAERLGLTIVHGNNPGFDAVGPADERYQIKYRATKNTVDINNFNFNFLV